jgi:Calpain family cysteine protease/Fibronectin type III domain
VKLSWTKAPSTSKYLIEYWSNGQCVNIGTMSKKTTACTVNGLQPGTTYFFDVCYVKGRWTYWETVKSAHTFAPPPPPGPPVCPWVIDHPVADDANGQYYNYAVVNGTLFGPNGPVYTDVHQTIIGDCWLLASFAEAAARAPQDITRMFTDLGIYMENGVQVHCWSVHFYNNYGALTSVIVDNELLVNSYGNTMSDEVYNGVLWVALAEKAYIQASALGYVTIDNLANDSYMSISGGCPYYALAAITGHQATDVSIDASGIDYDFSVGDLVVLCTGSTTSSSLIEPGHSNAVINDDPTATWQYTVYNPWGAGTYTTDDRGITVYGSTFYCGAGFINANWVAQDCAEA